MENIEAEKQAIKDYANYPKGLCPHCGRCPTCGQPYPHYNYPTYPQPWMPTYPPQVWYTCQTLGGTANGNPVGTATQ